MGNHGNHFNQINMDFLNQAKIEDNGDEKMSLVITIDAFEKYFKVDGSGSGKRVRLKEESVVSGKIEKATWLEKFHQHKHRDLIILCFVCIPIAVGILCFMVIFLINLI